MFLQFNKCSLDGFKITVFVLHELDINRISEIKEGFIKIDTPL